MRKMGFDESWIKLMMLCVNIVSYSIFVNGEPKGFIKPTRGIRQGDPLSHFLFLLCTKGFHGIITQAASKGDIHGFSLSKRSLKLTHLLFADNSLLFLRSTLEECQKILDVLGCMRVDQVNKLTDIRLLFSLVSLLLRRGDC